MPAYFLGDKIRLSAVFKNSAGTATDPTTISLKVRIPAGTIAEYTYAASELTRASAGNYYLDYAPATSGDYLLRWAGTGAVQAATEDHFQVLPSGF